MNQKSKQGFTLIELLVVVLIIGILAAVALPQYQKAVEKSKAAQALVLIKAVDQAMKAYQLANGVWPTQLDQLDITVPFTGNTKFVGNNVTDSRSNSDWTVELESYSQYVTLYVARISGRYKGAGFAVGYHNPTGTSSQQIRCTERISGANFLFDTSLPPGAYCEGILHGTLSSTDEYARYYRLP